MTLPLFVAPVPPPIPGIDLRLASVDDVIASLTAPVQMVHVDPAWEYSNKVRAGDGGNVSDTYDVLPMDVMARSIAASYDKAAVDCYMLLWCTSPMLRPWFLTEAKAPLRWQYLSAGAWAKDDVRPGVGYHWRGHAEYLLMYRKGNPKPLNRNLRNLHVSNRGEHSEKPAAWLAELVVSFCPVGGTVLDLYAGLAPMACAARATGRRYIGAEIDPERHERALGLIARGGRV